jgi:hypothetical protein
MTSASEKGCQAVRSFVDIGAANASIRTPTQLAFVGYLLTDMSVGINFMSL